VKTGVTTVPGSDLLTQMLCNFKMRHPCRCYRITSIRIKTVWHNTSFINLFKAICFSSDSIIRPSTIFDAVYNFVHIKVYKRPDDCSHSQKHIEVNKLINVFHCVVCTMRVLPSYCLQVAPTLCTYFYSPAILTCFGGGHYHHEGR